MAINLRFPSISHYSIETQSILYMISGALWFTSMTAVVRHLSHEMDVMEIAFFRNLFALVFMLPWVYRNGIRSVGTSKVKLYLFRGFNGMLAMVLWFYALSIIPLPEAISLSFTTPLFTTLMAMLFLHEKVGKHRWMALLVGFGGTLIITRPGFGNFEMAYLLVLGASLLWSISNILIKQLTRTESAHTIVFYMTLMMTPISFPLALLNWKTPNLTEFMWLIFLAWLANLAQICISRAYSHVDMAVVQPYDFTRLIFASIIAYFAFNEVIDLWTLIGAIVIVGSTYYISRRESQAKKKLTL